MVKLQGQRLKGFKKKIAKAKCMKKTEQATQVDYSYLNSWEKVSDDIGDYI